MHTLRMMQPRYLSVWQADNEQEYRKQIIKFAKAIGFDTVSAICVIDHSLTSTQFLGVDNTPDAYRESYEDANCCLSCPVMQHCKRSPIPIIWDQKTYSSEHQGALWEQQAQFGYKAGIALALHLPGDRHYFLGVDRDQTLPGNPRLLSRMTADLQLFAVYAQEAGFRLLCPTTENPENDFGLTPRELEVLRWTMDGQTAWEVGHSLNISERTAVFHLQNAVKKLGCKSKHHAVLTAMRLRLLS